MTLQIEENPYMPENAQLQADKLISLYKKGLCKKEYIENLKSELVYHSEGAIDLDISAMNDVTIK